MYGIKRDDPISAFEWAASLDQQAKRKSLVRSTLREWKKRDVSSAVDAVIAGNFPDEEQEYYLKYLGN